MKPRLLGTQSSITSWPGLDSSIQATVGQGRGRGRETGINDTTLPEAALAQSQQQNQTKRDPAYKTETVGDTEQHNIMARVRFINSIAFDH